MKSRAFEVVYKAASGMGKARVSGGSVVGLCFKGNLE